MQTGPSTIPGALHSHNSVQAASLRLPVFPTDEEALVLANISMKHISETKTYLRPEICSSFLTPAHLTSPHLPTGIDTLQQKCQDIRSHHRLPLEPTSHAGDPSAHILPPPKRPQSKASPSDGNLSTASPQWSLQRANMAIGKCKQE